MSDESIETLSRLIRHGVEALRDGDGDSMTAQATLANLDRLTELVTVSQIDDLSYDVKLMAALSEAAAALGHDRGTRSETVAERIKAIRIDRNALQTKLDDALLLAEKWRRSGDVTERWCGDDLKQVLSGS